MASRKLFSKSGLQTVGMFGVGTLIGIVMFNLATRATRNTPVAGVLDGTILG